MKEVEFNEYQSYRPDQFVKKSLFFNRLLIKWGVCKNDSSANIVLMVFSIILIIISISIPVIYFSGKKIDRIDLPADLLPGDFPYEAEN